MREKEEIMLIKAAQADPQRFAPLYELYFPLIFRFLARRTPQLELCADLTQQTFLKAMLALKAYRDHGVPFRAWLYRIALNEIRMYWRKRKEVVMDLTRAEAISVMEEAGIGEDDAQLKNLARALETLDEDRKKIMELRFMDGLSYAEIGAILGIREDAAKMRTHRILSHLRILLAKRE